MRKEKIQDFTRRISQSNRSELVVILFEMIDTYLEDASVALMEEEQLSFKENIRYADQVLQELQRILNFNYDLSRQLYSLYQYSRERLARSMMMQSEKELIEVRRNLEKLRSAFQEVAEQDHSKPLMQNTQKVSVGMTYGPKDVTEDYHSTNPNRGFFA